MLQDAMALKDKGVAAFSSGMKMMISNDFHVLLSIPYLAMNPMHGGPTSHTLLHNMSLFIHHPTMHGVSALPNIQSQTCTTHQIYIQSTCSHPSIHCMVPTPPREAPPSRSSNVHTGDVLTSVQCFTAAIASCRDNLHRDLDPSDLGSPTVTGGEEEVRAVVVDAQAAKDMLLSQLYANRWRVGGLLSQLHQCMRRHEWI